MVGLRAHPVSLVVVSRVSSSLASRRSRASGILCVSHLVDLMSLVISRVSSSRESRLCESRYSVSLVSCQSRYLVSLVSLVIVSLVCLVDPFFGVSSSR